jgi:hypothetical protein
MSSRVRRFVLATALVSGVGRSQRPAEIPIRTLAPATAKTSITFTQVDAVRQLPGGKLLVNDTRGRRMFVFDSTLRDYRVIVDTAPGAAASYPRVSPALIFYLADSTLFLDIGSQTLTLIEPGGALGRTVAVPNQQIVGNLIGSDTRPGVDQLGRLVFRGSAVVHSTSPFGGPPILESPDSAPVVRADFNTRTMDTLAWMKIPLGSRTLVSTDSRTGKTAIRFMRNPVGQQVDDIAVLANGSQRYSIEKTHVLR